MRIELFQSSFTRDYEENFQTIINQASESDADIVVFPELVFSGYCDDRLQNAEFVDQLLEMNKKMYTKFRNSNKIVVYGNIDYKNGQLYNSAFLVGKTLNKVYHKRNLPNYSIFYEDRYFSPGEKDNVIVTVGNYRIGIVVCEDLWQTNVVNDYAGVDILLSVNSSPFTFGKARQRLRMLSTRAQDLQCYLGYSNLVGIKDEIFFEGGTCALSPEGNSIDIIGEYEDDSIYMDVHKKSIMRRRLSTPTLKYFDEIPKSSARTGLHQENVDWDSKLHTPIDVTMPYKYAESSSTVRDILRAGIKDYVLKSGLQSVVVPTSGGLDSSTVLALTCDALQDTDISVHALYMPSKYNSKETTALVNQLVENIEGEYIDLDFKYSKVAIDEAMEGVDSIIDKHSFGGGIGDIADQNMQARLRMVLAMYLANLEGAHVFTGSNKSELLIGYGTLFGDMAGTMAPLKDVYKSMVFHIAAVDYDFIIPDGITTRRPSAELSEDQNDEDDLGLEYLEIDHILRMYYEESYTPKEIAKIRRLEQNKVDHIIKLTKNSEFKRYIVNLPGIKISNKSLTKYDWRQNFV